jgi:acetylornithine deacetylase/succinyl-diaminopimelate desuccinylase-like protein
MSELGPVEILQKLIRFDTTNPPGDERECIEWIATLIRDAPGAGCATELVGDPERPSLIARLSGAGDSPPLLLQGHVDVVPAEGEWTHPPFAAEIHDDFIWGRGALDMKGGVAMMLAGFLRAKAATTPPPGDVIFCALADEEGGSGRGAALLVRENPELFEGVRFAIGEFGAFTMAIGGKRLFPVMVAEKQVFWIRATFRGPAGHGSMPVRGGAMAKLGELLTGLDRKRLPVHVTPPVRMMIEAIAAELPLPQKLLLRAMLEPPATDRILGLLGERKVFFDPLLHNTVSATVVRGGNAANVIPGEVSVELDCRLLPGFGPEQVLAEIEQTTGVAIDEHEVLQHDPGGAEPDLGMFDELAAILTELDPGARVVPMVLPAVTDGRFFAALGIQTYGFLPMPLPEDLPFMQLIHAPDERIPVAAVEFGAEAIARLLTRF